MGSRGLPPYVLLPGHKKAVVLKVEDKVPVYRQGDPDFQPVDVVRRFGFPVPVTTLGAAAVANVCKTCPAVVGGLDQPAAGGEIATGGEDQEAQGQQVQVPGPGEIARVEQEPAAGGR